MQSSLLGRAVFLCSEMQDAGRAEISASVVSAVLWGQQEGDGPSSELQTSRKGLVRLSGGQWARDAETGAAATPDTSSGATSGVSA